MNITKSSAGRSSPKRASAQERSESDAVLRSGDRSQQDPDRHAVQKLFKVKVAEVRTVEQRGKLRRRGGSPDIVRLEKAYVRLEGRREDAGVRGDLSDARSRSLSTDNSDPPLQTVVSREDITKDTPEKSLVERQAQDRRPQQHRPRHVAVHRRRSQADVPDHRFQARQDGRSGEGGGDRIRSEPHGAHRAAATMPMARSATSSLRSASKWAAR